MPVPAALWNQLNGAGRGGIWFAAGFAVGYGILTGETAIGIAGGVITAVAAWRTSSANADTSITAAFSAMPTTKAIEVSDAKLAQVAKIADSETKVKFVPQPKEEV